MKDPYNADVIICIDGSAGSGKSTAARKLAARLEIPYLDTGAMYRAIAYWAIQEHVDVHKPEALLDVARRMYLEVDCGPTHTRVRINGHDVSELIRGIEVSKVTSPFVARVQGIRDLLIERQRELGSRLGSLVTEGRDQGSVVFPDAEVKFVLDASLEKRAERRLHEMQAEGEEPSYDEVLAHLRTRDGVDAKQWAPLLQPGMAILIDTTKLTINQVVEGMMEQIKGFRVQGSGFRVQK